MFGGDLLSHGNHTIIGAKSFHGPVRDGKAWDQLAMAAKLKLSNRNAEIKVMRTASVSFISFEVLQMIESSLTSN